MSILTKIDLFFNYRFYGSDEFGNRYFIAKKIDPVLKKQKRMVQYNGSSEATKVPPVWHAWLHYLIDEVDEGVLNSYDWQKSYLPNLTGTSLAYIRKWHVERGEDEKGGPGKFGVWTPKQ